MKRVMGDSLKIKIMIGVIVGLSIALIYFMYFSALREYQYKMMKTDFSTQMGEREKMEKAIGTLRTLAKMKDIRAEKLSNGLKPDNVVEDLIENGSIPYEGVKGGEMKFYDKYGIKVLNEKWVLAPFDDGHINGFALLEYEVSGSDIKWKILSSYLER